MDVFIIQTDLDYPGQVVEVQLHERDAAARVQEMRSKIDAEGKARGLAAHELPQVAYVRAALKISDQEIHCFYGLLRSGIGEASIQDSYDWKALGGIHE